MQKRFRNLSFCSRIGEWFTQPGPFASNIWKKKMIWEIRCLESDGEIWKYSPHSIEVIHAENYARVLTFQMQSYGISAEYDEFSNAEASRNIGLPKRTGVTRVLTFQIQSYALCKRKPMKKTFFTKVFSMKLL